MNNPIDPLAALKKTSPNDPILPVLEHLIGQGDALKQNAAKIAKNAQSLRNTRIHAFILCGVISAGIGYVSASLRNPDMALLRKAGVEVVITDSQDQLRLILLGGHGKGHAFTKEENPKGGFSLTWEKP